MGGSLSSQRFEPKWLTFRVAFIPFKNGVKKRSSYMHHHKVAEFLMELAEECNIDEVFSFLCGIIGHYALDSTTHPLIDELAINAKYMHRAIERKLDSLELEQLNKSHSFIMKMFVPFCDIEEVWSVIIRIYGWNELRLQTSYQHMKYYHWIVKDQLGILRFITMLMPKKIQAISYRNSLCNSIDLSAIKEMRRKAVARGVELINAAYDYRIGRIGKEVFRSVIGEKDYSGVGGLL